MSVAASSLKPHKFCTMFGGPGKGGDPGWDQDRQGWKQGEQGWDDPREHGWDKGHWDRGRGGGRGGEAPRDTVKARQPRRKWSTHGGKDTDDPGYGHNTANPNAWCLDRDRHPAAALPATGLLVQPSDRLYATADGANEAKRQETKNPRGGQNHAFPPWEVLKVLWPYSIKKMNEIPPFGGRTCRKKPAVAAW